MFTADESSLEKYVDVHVYVPPIDMEKWDVFFHDIVSYVSKEVGVCVGYSNENAFYETVKYVSVYLRPVLSTPRDLKSFGRNLLNRLKTPARTLNAVDLVCIVAIETKNPRLFDWIARNRINLVESRSLQVREKIDVDIQFINEGRNASDGCSRKQDVDNMRKGDVARSFYKDLVESHQCSHDEFRLFLYLFFRGLIEFDAYRCGVSESTKIEMNCARITSNLFFCNYFFRDSLPDMASLSLKRKVEELVSDDKVDELLCVVLDDYKKQARIDLKQLVLDSYKRYMGDEEFPKNYKMLVVYGRLLRQLRVYEEDDFNSFDESGVIWEVLFDLDRKQLVECLYEIVSMKDVSDVFVSSVVFYAVECGRNRKKVYFSPEEQEELKRIFCKNCRERFLGENVFNKFISDAPISILYRWSYCDDRKVIENYLVKLFKLYPEKFVEFLSEFQVSDLFPFEKRKKDLNMLISTAKLKELISDICEETISSEGVKSLINSLKNIEE